MSLDHSHISGWLQPLPKLIWEISDSSPATSALAVRMLLDAARFTPDLPAVPQELRKSKEQEEVANAQGTASAPIAPPPAPLRLVLGQLQRQMAPLLCIHITAQKPQAKPQPPASSSWLGGGGDRGVTPGPLSKLPSEVQLLFIDLMYHMGELN